MKYAKKLKILFTVIISCACFIVSSLYLLGSFKVYAAADSPKFYSDDVYFESDYITSGTVASYDVYFDRMEETFTGHLSAPSFYYYDDEYTNGCAPLAGLNVVGFYNRWSTNLLPGYTAGLTFSGGKFQYYPYTGSPIVENAFDSLYKLMKTSAVGTTSANFKSGLITYVKNAGYDISFSSFYQGKNSVNLNALTEAFNNNKVGLIMCSEYNYVYSVVYDNTQAHITQRNYAVGHMMMVYGYKNFKFYKDNQLIRDETFLCVCSSYSTGDKGYMKLYDYSEIDEAWIISIA